MKIIRLFTIIVTLFALYFLIKWASNPNASPYWTGFGKYDEKISGPRAKTLWDWLDLLIIPIVLGVFGWLFKEAEKENVRKSDEERSQNDTLDAFIKIMTELIIKNSLTKKDSSIETRIIARTRINLAFGSLNAERKGQVLQFLFESGLIDIKPKINLNGSNIKNAILDGIVLSRVEIRGAYMNNSSIKDSNLNESTFTSCDFTNADLSGSLTNNLDLSYTNLTGAKLKNMDLTSINFEGADLTNADLRESNILQSQLDGIFNKNNIKITKSKIK